MKNKLVWAILAFLIGFLLFMGGSQYLGAAIIAGGLFLADLYSDERKKSKSVYIDKNK